MNVLITGGCGFIGCHLAASHLKLGDTVWVIDDLSSGTPDNLADVEQHPNLNITTDDLLTWNRLHEAVLWADRIYHLAAVVGVFKVLAEPVKVVRSNITGCERLFAAMQENNSNARVVIASSSSVYGSNTSDVLKETDSFILNTQDNPLAPYAISKMAQESIALAYHKSAGIPVTIARLFNVVGLHQTGRYGMVVPRFTQQACKNQPITIFGSGKQTRSFCDVRDAIHALQLLAQSSQTLGEVINVGNDHEISIEHLAHLVRERAQSASEFTHISYEEAYGRSFMDTTQRRPCLDKLKLLTGFKHKWQLKDTIDELVQYYQQQDYHHHSFSGRL